MENAAPHDLFENFRMDQGSQLLDLFWNTTENQLKNQSKHHLNFKGFLVDFSFEIPPKIRPKTSPKPLKNQSKIQSIF